jgi:hypothetical protein
MNVTVDYKRMARATRLAVSPQLDDAVRLRARDLRQSMAVPVAAGGRADEQRMAAGCACEYR